MKTEPSIIKLYDRINEFKTALTAGIEGIVKAAEVYVKTVDLMPESADKFREAAADFPSKTWKMFEQIGRKQVHPKLLFGGGIEARTTAILKRLPYSQQDAVFHGARFELLTASGDKLNVSPLEATPEQVEQLCSGGVVRTVAEQKAYLSTPHKNTKSVSDLPSYESHGGKVSFRRGATLTRADLKNILAEM